MFYHFHKHETNTPQNAFIFKFNALLCGNKNWLTIKKLLRIAFIIGVHYTTLYLYHSYIEHITYDDMIQCVWYLHSIKMLQFAKEILWFLKSNTILLEKKSAFLQRVDGYALHIHIVYMQFN